METNFSEKSKQNFGASFFESGSDLKADISTRDALIFYLSSQITKKEGFEHDIFEFLNNFFKSESLWH